MRSNLRASIKESLGNVLPSLIVFLPPCTIYNYYLLSPLLLTLLSITAYMGYHMFSFFIYMWLLVSSLTKNDINPIAPQEMPW